MAHGQPLGHQFADDERKVGNDQYDEAQTGFWWYAPRPGNALRVLRQPLRHAAAGEGAGQDADECDADLHRGEQSIGRLRQLQRDFSAGVAFLDPVLQPRLARRDHRHFRHGKHAVRQDQ